MTRIALIAATAVLLPLFAFAHDAVTVRDAYVLTSNPKTAAAFMQIENHRDVDCQLVKAETHEAERVELHTHLEEDGVMKMTHVEEGFPVSAHGTHRLERGGDHVMMMGVKQPLEEDHVVKLKLDFGDCGTLDVEAPVVSQATARTMGTSSGEADAADHSGH